MDCHRCENLRYDGYSYGHCIHRGHRDVRLTKRSADSGCRPYNKQICPDFVMKRRCSNCHYWKRGKYFSDGRTPAIKGACSLRIVERNGHDCPLWKRSSSSGRHGVPAGRT